MKKHITYLFLLLAASAPNLVFAQQASGQFNTIAGYLNDSRSDYPARMYLLGAFNAYEIMNTALQKRGEKEFFCTPPELVVKSENLDQMVKTALAKRQAQGISTQGSTTIEIPLFYALVETFPCSS